jgi:hypothetical protein
VGDSLQFQHPNPPAFSIQDSSIPSERALIHKHHRIHGDLQMNIVLSETKKWNTKSLTHSWS